MSKNKIINHLGENRNDYKNAVTPPLFQTSNFVFESIDRYRKAMSDEFHHHLYTRGNNPTVLTLREKIAALQGTDQSLVFSSGMAAITSTLYTFLNQNDHVICIENVYGWTREFLNQANSKMNIETTFLPNDDFRNIEDYIQENTKIIYLESPTSLLFEMQDLETISTIAKSKNIITMIDNSYAGLLNPSPSDFGIDLILHSASKYIGGHSDVVAGVVCGSEKHLRNIYHHGMMTLGGCIAPMDAWLLIRSLRTLPILTKQAAENCQAVIDFLRNRSEIKAIHYPFLESSPYHMLAQKYMSTPMPMFTIELYSNNQDKIEAFCNTFDLILMGPSWGGHESLMFPTCVFDPEDERAKLPNNLIRFYIGLDDPNEIIDDFEQALKIFNA